jgi:DNA-directed RNA polymerase subunit RPC12/RpoP
MLLKATCTLCGLPIPQAPEMKAMCRVCDDGTKRMLKERPNWIDELVRRMEAR